MEDRELWFYDIGPDPKDVDEQDFPVQRIYCLKWDAFQEDDWKKLEEIGAVLPGYVGTIEGETFWFGTDVETETALSACSEPSGWHVFGSLRYSDWVSWDAQFRRLAVDLPWRTVR